MGKVPQYNLNAINRYNAKFDRIAANLPRGYKDIINNTIGMSCNAYINQLVQDDFIKRGLLETEKTLDKEKTQTLLEECPF